MSQQKLLTNFEKAKALRDLRKGIGFTQEQMGDALGLDSTYLSQLENGHREVDAWYVEKARFFVASFEKSKTVKETAPEFKTGDPRLRCIAYLNRVLDACKGDQDRLAWTYIELTRRFPLPSSSAAAAEEEILDAAVSGTPDPSQSSSHLREVAEPTSQIYKPMRGAVVGSKARRGPLKKVPK